MEKRILTLHPDPAKTGVNISLAKYEQMRGAIVDVLQRAGELSFTDLAEQVEQRFAGRFAGSVLWYYTTVKLDLEARGLLERVPKSRPQLLRLASNKRKPS